jgi:hypothetical protein
MIAFDNPHAGTLLFIATHDLGGAIIRRNSALRGAKCNHLAIDVGSMRELERLACLPDRTLAAVGAARVRFGLSLDSPLIIEATMRGGVHLSPLEWYASDGYTLHTGELVGTGAHVFTAQHRDLFLARCLNYLGVPYDFRALPGFLISTLLNTVSINLLQAPARAFCDEFPGEVIHSLGFYIIDRTESPSAVTPEDWRRSKIVRATCSCCKT